MLFCVLQTLKNLWFILRMYMFGTGLEVKAHKTKYMVMSWDQNAGQTRNIIIEIVPLKGWNISCIWEQN